MTVISVQAMQNVKIHQEVTTVSAVKASKVMEEIALVSSAMNLLKIKKE